MKCDAKALEWMLIQPDLLAHEDALSLDGVKIVVNAIVTHELRNAQTAQRDNEECAKGQVPASDAGQLRLALCRREPHAEVGMSQQDDFERWANARGRISLCKRPDGSYAFPAARAAWDAWQHLTALSVPALRRRTRIHYNGEEIGTMEHRT